MTIGYSGLTRGGNNARAIKWDFDDALFNRTAESFGNPDHLAIVIHNYRWRLG